MAIEADYRVHKTCQQEGKKRGHYGSTKVIMEEKRQSFWRAIACTSIPHYNLLFMWAVLPEQIGGGPGEGEAGERVPVERSRHFFACERPSIDDDAESFGLLATKERTVRETSRARIRVRIDGAVQIGSRTGRRTCFANSG